MRLVSSRDCRRVSSSFRQLCSTLTRTSSKSGEFLNLISDTARKLTGNRFVRNFTANGARPLGRFNDRTPLTKRLVVDLRIVKRREHRAPLDNFPLTYIPVQCITLPCLLKTWSPPPPNR